MSEENSDEVKMLEAQIERLQAEVEVLKLQQQENHKDLTLHFPGHMRDALAHLCGQRAAGGQEEVLSKLREEIQELEADLELQTQMNGISLSRCLVKTLQSGRKLVQKLCLSGHCSELVFQVEFKLSEMKVGQSCERRLSELNVVLDSPDLRSFSSFLSRVEESGDLLLFFRTLRTFSDRCDDRARTFRHFQELFPSMVRLPGGCRSEVMSLSPPELPGLALLLHWSVEVSGEGAVSPKLSLLPRIPQTALRLFPSGPVGGAAEAFQSLLSVLGPEAAVGALAAALGGGSG
ncbi:centromere protein P isoform 2-T5 [Menidia menidia]